jgi:hypothetical protein
MARNGIDQLVYYGGVTAIGLVAFNLAKQGKLGPSAQKAAVDIAGALPGAAARPVSPSVAAARPIGAAPARPSGPQYPSSPTGPASGYGDPGYRASIPTVVTVGGGALAPVGGDKVLPVQDQTGDASTDPFGILGGLGKLFGFGAGGNDNPELPPDSGFGFDTSGEQYGGGGGSNAE